jgi:hypothetical protein
MAPGCYMLDFSVYKPPAEFKINHTTGGENAKKWSVSAAIGRLGRSRGAAGVAGGVFGPPVADATGGRGRWGPGAAPAPRLAPPGAPGRRQGAPRRRGARASA